MSQDSARSTPGQQVLTACAFIHHNFDGVEKVFLPRRAATKKFLPNKYELPGGHVDFGEDMVAGLQREVREELGQEIEVGDPFAVFTYMNDIKGSHSIEVDYFARFAAGAPEVQLNPEDHSTYGWFAEDELDGILPPDDDETRAISRGFSLLRGEKLHF